jgi:hypothetical protein
MKNREEAMLALILYYKRNMERHKVQGSTTKNISLILHATSFAKGEIKRYM